MFFFLVLVGVRIICVFLFCSVVISSQGQDQTEARRHFYTAILFSILF